VPDFNGNEPTIETITSETPQKALVRRVAEDCVSARWMTLKTLSRSNCFCPDVVLSGTGIVYKMPLAKLNVRR
jgi:hypothetical protein